MTDAHSQSVEPLALQAIPLLVAYQQGDRGAARELIILLTPLFFKFFCARAGNVAQAEDLAQEFWLRVHEARASYRPGEPALPWLFAIARNTRADSQRKWYSRLQRESSPMELVAEPSFDPRQTMENSLFSQSIQERLRHLPEGQREIFLMLKVQGLSVAEVAQASGLSPAAVKQKAFRAYERLRELLRPRSVAAGSGRPAMNCQEFLRELANTEQGYSPERMSQMQAHMSTCPACRATWSLPRPFLRCPNLRPR